MGDAFRVALHLDDTPEWRAQAEIAKQAPEPEEPAEKTAREVRLATLREFVALGYKTANMASP
jgi:hypothetical protein